MAARARQREERKGEGSSQHYVIQQYGMAPTARRAAGRAACWQVADGTHRPWHRTRGHRRGRGAEGNARESCEKCRGVRSEQGQCFRQQRSSHSITAETEMEVKEK